MGNPNQKQRIQAEKLKGMCKMLTRSLPQHMQGSGLDISYKVNMINEIAR